MNDIFYILCSLGQSGQRRTTNVIQFLLHLQLDVLIMQEVQQGKSYTSKCNLKLISLL